MTRGWSFWQVDMNPSVRVFTGPGPFVLALLGALALGPASAAPAQVALNSVPSGMVSNLLDCGAVREIKITYSGMLDCNKLRELTNTPQASSYTLRLTLERSALSRGVDANFDLFGAILKLFGLAGNASVNANAGDSNGSDVATVDIPVRVGSEVSTNFGGQIIVPTDKGLQTVPYGFSVTVKEAGNYAPLAQVSVSLSTAQRSGQDITSQNAQSAFLVGLEPVTVSLSIASGVRAGQVGTTLRYTDTTAQSSLTVTARLINDRDSDRDRGSTRSTDLAVVVEPRRPDLAAK